MATTTTQKEGNSTKAPGQQQQTPLESPSSNDASLGHQQPAPPTAGTDLSPKETDESKSDGNSSETGDATNSKAAKNNDSNNDATVSDAQKKMRRAERFGMPVQISEEEKRSSRAERFGTGNGTGIGTGTGTGSGSSVHGSDALTKSEEQKRKARGERFGSVLSVPADEEAKKKARLARFTAIPQTDPLEEQKKEARALRFSQAPSGSLSQVNGKANDIATFDLQKTASTGKAGGET